MVIKEKRIFYVRKKKIKKCIGKSVELLYSLHRFFFFKLLFISFTTYAKITGTKVFKLEHTLLP